mmetsp:Transcript_48659/g.141860  ORF Transcript_48659/g.141860 Transcript_48659/m.141860 type:complete len:267 (+) Transcript_48659:629-1429(+)
MGRLLVALQYSRRGLVFQRSELLALHGLRPQAGLLPLQRRELRDEGGLQGSLAACASAQVLHRHERGLAHEVVLHAALHSDCCAPLQALAEVRIRLVALPSLRARLRTLLALVCRLDRVGRRGRKHDRQLAFGRHVTEENLAPCSARGLSAHKQNRNRRDVLSPRRERGSDCLHENDGRLNLPDTVDEPVHAAIIAQRIPVPVLFGRLSGDDDDHVNMLRDLGCRLGVVACGGDHLYVCFPRAAEDAIQRGDRPLGAGVHVTRTAA